MTDPKPGVSRRDFLKLAGAAAFGLACAGQPEADPPAGRQAPRLGRTTWPLNIYERPTFVSKRVGPPPNAGPAAWGRLMMGGRNADFGGVVDCRPTV